MNKIPGLITVLLGTLFLFAIAIYNGYPLLISDSGTYIDSGILRFVPFDRPVSYGLFIDFISCQKSLWLVVFVQNAMTAFVIFEICRLFVSTKNLRFVYLFVITILVLFTGVGWYTNQIMPDFFTALLCLLIFLLWYTPNISAVRYTVFSLMLILSVIVHFSHLLIGTGVLLAIFVFDFAGGFKKPEYSVVKRMKKFIPILLLVLSGWIIVPAVNYAINRKFEVSKTSHVFFMAHMVDNGILRAFLKEKCPTDEYKDCRMCLYKDSLPNELGVFLWESNGVLQKTGGWLNSKEEYSKIIKGTLNNPKYLVSHIKKNVIYCGIQLFKNEIGEGLVPYMKGSAPYISVENHFNHELNFLISSKQHSFYLKSFLETINFFNGLLNIFSLFILIIIFFSSLRQQINLLSLRLLQFSLITLVINAMVTAGLNAPSARFQARVTWILSFAILIALISNFNLIKEKIRRLIFS